MEILVIVLTIMLFVGSIGYLHHQLKFRDTPNKLHHCNVPYDMYFHHKEDWKCRKCKSYWYVKYDKFGSYYVKRK